MGRHKTPDSSQVFDVSKPGRSAPSHTARPVIVDHHQVANDPMVTGATDSQAELMTHAGKPVVPIQVNSDHGEHKQTPTPDAQPDQSDNFFGNTPETAAGEQSSYKPDQPTEPEPEAAQTSSGFHNDSDQPVHEQMHGNQSGDTQSTADSPPLPAELTAPGADDPVGLSSVDSPGLMFAQPPGPAPEEQSPTPTDSNAAQTEAEHSGVNSEGEDNSKKSVQLPPVPENIGEIEHLPLPAHPTHMHFTDEPTKRKWFLSGLLLFLIGAFLILDAGIVGSGNLPFEIFKEEEEATTETTPPISQTPASQIAPPATTQNSSGFTQYVLPNTPLSFTYPTVWGTPSVTADPGFTKRGGSSKSDGTYAHLINFETNKDIQLVLTSSKYLPAKRPAQYFDFLQWCSGTHDGKIYRQQLLFSTTSGVDSPSTITCNDGPLSDTEKIDELTVVQKSAKDSAGKAIGDVYIKNLSDKEFTVLRAKDSAMSSADTIKQLLSSVKITSATANSD